MRQVFFIQEEMSERPSDIFRETWEVDLEKREVKLCHLHSSKRNHETYDLVYKENKNGLKGENILLCYET